MAEIRNADDVLALLHARYETAKGWALFENVANGTGRHGSRWADALAMSLYPSRGLDVHGFEIKVDRRDVLRELKQPKKADAVGAYCDFWWLALSSADLLRDGDNVPDAWGILAPKAERKSMALHVVKEARRLDAKPMDRTFFAALVRRAHEQYDAHKLRNQVQANMYETLRIRAEEQADAALRREIESLKRIDEHQTKTIDGLRKQLDDAQAALDRLTNGVYSPPVIASAIALLSKLAGWKGIEQRSDSAMRQLDHASEHISSIIETLREVHEIAETLNGKKEEPPL